MSNGQSIQNIEWDGLYEDILALMSKYGENDFLCSKDFWLVDDNWGTAQHKIYFTNHELFRDDIFYEIRTIIEGYDLPWEVICVETRDDKCSGLPTVLITKVGIERHEGGIDDQ